MTVKTVTRKLTNKVIENLRTPAEMYWIKDSNTKGLYLEVAISGSKIWFQRYKHKGRDTKIYLGHYLKNNLGVSILNARQARNKNKQLLLDGVDPKQYLIQTSLAQENFEDMFHKWYQFRNNLTGNKKWSHDYSISIMGRAKLHLLPKLGKLTVNSINTRTVIDILTCLEEDGKLDTLNKVQNILSRVFKYCIKKGVIAISPMDGLEKISFEENESVKYPAPTEPREIGKLLKTIEEKCNGGWQVFKALELAPLLLLRPGELVWIEWDEVDFDENKIYFSEDKTKKRRALIIPMSNQAVSIFKELKSIDTGSIFVFPSPSNINKHINPNSLLQSIRRTGITKEQFVTHGFRAMGSTVLNENRFRSDAIEMQLNHVEKNKSRAPYNRAKYLEERAEMMQWYSDYILGLKSNATGYIC